MIFKKKNRDDLQNKIDQLYQESEQLNKHGQYKEAMDSYLKLSTIVRQNFGENHPAYALSQNNLALIYRNLGDYGKAEALFRKVLDICNRVLGENHPDYATSLSNLALVYQDTHDFSKAEALYQKALEIQRKVVGENHQDYANSLSNLAGLYDQMLDLSKAEALYQKALEIRGQVLGQDHPKYANTLHNLAVLYLNMGDYGKAEVLFLKALIIMRKLAGGENHPSYATIMEKLAELYLYIGDFTKSEPLFQKALEIQRKVLGENHPSYAMGLNNLARLYVRMGDYGKAEPLFQKALEIQRKVLGENDSEYAQGLNNLAFMYVRMGDYGKAEPLFQKALEIQRKVLGENHPSYANTLNNLALLYVATSRQVRAFKILQEFVSIEDKTADLVFSIASDRQRMAFILEIQNSFYGFLSLVLQQFSQDQQAIQNALDLVMRRKSIVAEVTTVQREIVLAGKYPQLKSTVIELNNVRRQISQKSLAGPVPGETLDKYKQYLEELNSKKEQLETKLAHQIPEVQIQQSLKKINSKTISNALPEGAALIEFVRFDNYNFHAIPAKGDLQWNSPRYLAFILRSKEPDNIQMIDLGDAGFIDKMVTHFRMSIIEGRPSAQESQEENQDDGRHLVALDTSDYSSYHIPNNNNVSLKFSWKEIGYQLYELIFHPLLSNAIGEDCKNLFIAPDGDLSRLPFEVLPTNKGDGGGTRLLIDDYSITYLTNARDILQINKISYGTPNESIVAADPDFDLDSNSSSNSANITNSIDTSTHNAASIEKEVIIESPISNRLSRDFDRSAISFNRLQGTKYEGQEIAELFGVQLWTAEKVLESRLKSFRSPKILHIATHGFFLANQHHDPGRSDGVVGGTNLFDRLSGESLENPMLRSGLALAGANTWIQNKPLREEAEDGILTAEDVSIMDLSDTELVVLSACETGLGQVLTGEGVFGLRRSFVLAGAKTLVMSLWKVPDEQTKELMVDFYNLLLSGKGRAEALREAQLAMKNKYPNPYYWGAFICQGNPGPIMNKIGE